MKPFPAQGRSDFVTFLLRQNSTIDNQLLAWIFRWYRVTHIQCREGLHALPKKWHNRWKISRIRELKNYYKWHKRKRNMSNIVFGRAWSPSLHRAVPTSSLFCWDQIAPLIIKHLQGELGDIGWRISSAGKGFMPFLKNDPTAEKYQELEN